MKKFYQKHVVVIDDDIYFHPIIIYMLKKYNISVECFLDWEDALIVIKDTPPSVVLLDRHLDNADGLEVLPKIQAVCKDLPVVLITTDDSIDMIVEAIKQGAYDFIVKPVDEARLVACILNAQKHRQLAEDLSIYTNDTSYCTEFEGIIGESPSIKTVFNIIKHVADCDVNVFITGESGTGKEMVAQAIHNRSNRKKKPFLALNMASIPHDLLESMLFGHEQGAFTGANKKHVGACEEAKGGTLFLDEISEMPLDLQPKLLRFLQERTYRPVGGTKDIVADVRVLSATNLHPDTGEFENKLREDLYYRLNVVPIELPPLRKRVSDIELLANVFLKQNAIRYHKKIKGFSHDSLVLLKEYHWPGNVRQLAHFIERIVVLNDDEVVLSSMLPPEIHYTENKHNEKSCVKQVVNESDNGFSSLDYVPKSGQVIPLEELEVKAIVHAIHSSDGSITTAASKLNISAATIYRKMKKHNIPIQDI